VIVHLDSNGDLGESPFQQHVPRRLVSSPPVTQSTQDCKKVKRIARKNTGLDQAKVYT
jgi:hypothetical protein